MGGGVKRNLEESEENQGENSEGSVEVDKQKSDDDYEEGVPGASKKRRKDTSNKAEGNKNQNETTQKSTANKATAKKTKGTKKSITIARNAMDRNKAYLSDRGPSARPYEAHRILQKFP